MTALWFHKNQFYKFMLFKKNLFQICAWFDSQMPHMKIKSYVWNFNLPQIFTFSDLIICCCSIFYFMESETLKTEVWIFGFLINRILQEDRFFFLFGVLRIGLVFLNLSDWILLNQSWHHLKMYCMYLSRPEKVWSVY